MSVPRLLTERAVAEYLSLPIAGVRKVTAGRIVLSGRVRWDRIALDEWLDELRGRPSELGAPNQNLNAADDALTSWLADQKNAPRHS